MSMLDCSFTWRGKDRAYLAAQAPPVGRLRPCREESVDWDATQNLFIEGDNLEVLKLLQEPFHRKVKMIYIDPPYNTGNEFVYPDDYAHAEWLNMIYPRLALARNLLRDDGVIFISIDDREFANLRKLCDEVYGEENFCGVFIWEKKKKPSFLNANMGSLTEYILCFAKDRPKSPPFVAGSVKDGKNYPFNNAGNGIQTLTFPAGAVRFNCTDQVVAAQDMSTGNIKTELLDDVTILDGRNLTAFRLRGEWRYSQRRLDEFVEQGAEIVISKVPFRPNYVNRRGDVKKTPNLLSYRTNGVPTNEDATQEIRDLFGADVMSYTKPSGLIKYLVRAVTTDDDIVMDFFAGSGSTAHGVMLQNMEDGCNRRYILVQLAQPLDPDAVQSRPALEFCQACGLRPTIAEIGKERIRRAAKNIRSEQGRKAVGLDLGFRLLKLDSGDIAFRS